MEAVRKVLTLNDASLTFNELNQFIGQKVEVIVLPLFDKISPAKQSQKDRSLFFQFQGAVTTGATDTSLRVDELIYGHQTGTFDV